MDSQKVVLLVFKIRRVGLICYMLSTQNKPHGHAHLHTLMQWILKHIWMGAILQQNGTNSQCKHNVQGKEKTSKSLKELQFLPWYHMISSSRF